MTVKQRGTVDAKCMGRTWTDYSLAAVRCYAVLYGAFSQEFQSQA